MKIHQTIAMGLLAMITTVCTAADSDLQAVPAPLQYCTVCHGVQLRGNPSTHAPRLSGLPAWYIARQLHSFQQQWRGTVADDAPGNEMRIAAEGISAEQIPMAAKFASNTQSPPPAATLSGDVARGESLYQSCAACHGGKGHGNEGLSAPPLAARSDWYLLKQLQNFASGKRGVDSDDISGQQMRASVAVLPDEQAMVDVISYINTL